MKVEKNWLEWTVFAVSLLILLGFAVSLGYMVLGSGDRPAEIVVELSEPRRSPAGFSVPVRVHNRGDRTAEEVRVVVTLDDDRSSEERELTFPLLPRRSMREGVVVFARNPRCCRLSGSASSHQEP